MTEPLGTVWHRYLDLLAEQAPRTRASVRPPAGRTSEFEARLGLAVTDELVEWFGLHDGQGDEMLGELLPFHTLCGVDDAIEHTKMIREIWADMGMDMGMDEDVEPVAGSVAFTWLPEYLFIADDNSGGGLFVDTRPGPQQGCVRTWDKVEADDGEPLAASLAELIARTMRDVRDREPGRYGEQVQIEDGVLEWIFAD